MKDEKGTVHLHRVLRAPPEKVYKAFLDPGALERWLPPYGFTGKIHQMDARVGGGYTMSFTNFSTGSSHSFSVKYIELVAAQRIQYTDTFDDPKLPGEMLVSVDLKSVVCGKDLTIQQQGIPTTIPLEFCYLGWQESLKMLARVVEPNIPNSGK